MEKQTRKGQIISRGQTGNRQISASTVRAHCSLGTLLGTEASYGMEANGKGQSPLEQLPASPSGSLAVEVPTACSTLPLGEASCVGSPKDPVPGAGFHLPPHLGHSRTHTCMWLNRVHALVHMGFMEHSRGSWIRQSPGPRAFCWGLSLSPTHLKAFFSWQSPRDAVLTKLARSHQRAIVRFIVGQPLGQATYQVSSFSSPL